MLSARSPTGDKVTIVNGSPHGGHVKYDVEVRDVDHIAFDRPAAIFNGEPYRAHLLVSNGPLTSGGRNVHARNASRCSQQLGEQLATVAGGPLFKCKLSASRGDTGGQQQLLASIAVQPVFDRDAGAYACDVRLLGSDAAAGWPTDAQLELEAVLGNGLAAARMLLQLVPAVQVQPRGLVAERLAEQLLTLRGVDKVLQKVEVSCSGSIVTGTNGKWFLQIHYCKNKNIT